MYGDMGRKLQEHMDTLASMRDQKAHEAIVQHTLTRHHPYLAEYPTLTHGAYGRPGRLSIPAMSTTLAPKRHPFLRIPARASLASNEKFTACGTVGGGSSVCPQFLPPMWAVQGRGR